MQQPGQRKQNIWMPLLFSVVLVIGMLLGYKLDKSLSTKRNIADLIERNDRIDEIIELVNSRYVDSISKDTIYHDAIQGVLSHLDPFTFYIPAMKMAATQANLDGKSTGIGFEYAIYEDTLLVISVIPNAPAEKAGMKIGDRIIAINKQKVSGVQITDAEVKQIVNNPETVTVKFQLVNSADKVQTIEVLKGTVPLPSIDAYYMKSSTVGYIRINRFSATTYSEFKDAVLELQANGLQELVLDLRENPGGYVDDAIALLDEIIAGDKTLVNIKGRNNETSTLDASNPGILENGKIVVLINEASASAAEIVAGAIQDWDRGVILGRKSFGKGLIQEQFELSDGSALRLTIAKYYTPSGRPIQKVEAPIVSLESMDEWDQESIYQDFVPEEQYFTLVNKRPLPVENGGVIPDAQVALPNYLTSSDLWKVLNMVDVHTVKYFAAHIDYFRKYTSYQQFFDQYQVSNEALLEYKRNIPVKYIQAVNTVWADPKMLSYVKLKIKANFARLLFRSQGYYKVMNSEDFEVRKAFDIINSTTYNQLLHVKK